MNLEYKDIILKNLQKFSGSLSSGKYTSINILMHFKGFSIFYIKVIFRIARV